MIGGIILAAGGSSRMGGFPKQLLPYRERTMLTNVVEKMLEARIDKIIVVIGYCAERIKETLTGLPVKIVVNKEYDNGQSTSLKMGLGELNTATRAAIFMLGDQPLVKAETINLLVNRYKVAGGIVAPSFNGFRGNPVIFDRKYFDEILALSGDVGARKVIAQHLDCLETIDVADCGVIFDIDTWEDYRYLLSGEGDSFAE